jgi:hypothetical protein
LDRTMHSSMVSGWDTARQPSRSFELTGSSEAMATSAIEKLTAAFDENFTNRVHAAEGEGPAVVLSWPSVPIEIVRATGLRPVVARGDSAATPAADAHVERGIFPSRLKHLMDAALAGRLSHAARLIIPRTSDPDYKCFLYLREFVRLEIAATVPSTIYCSRTGRMCGNITRLAHAYCSRNWRW